MLVGFLEVQFKVKFEKSIETVKVYRRILELE